MKVHAFKITARGDFSLDQVLAYINQIPLEERLRPIGGGDLRLEAAQKAGNVWSLDFGSIRSQGPGRASPTTPIADFDMNDDEGFGEETAAIFNTSTGFMAIQFNFRGPRSGRIQSYLFRFARLMGGLVEDVPDDDDHGFTLSPVFKHGVVEQFNRAAVVKKFRMSIFIPGIAHAEHTTRQSLSSILDNPVIGSGANLNLEISAGRKKRSSLNIPAIRTMAREALGLGDAVQSLEAMIKEI